MAALVNRRTLTVECLAIQIPDSIVVKISTLEIGHALHVRDLEVPPNTKILNNPDAVVVRVAQPGAELDLTTGAAGEEGPAQPEVIGRKPAEGEEAAEGEKVFDAIRDAVKRARLRPPGFVRQPRAIQGVFLWKKSD